MKTIKTGLLGILLSVPSFTLLMAQLTVNSLHAGSDAPPVKIMKWIKGEPKKKFEKGHIYVVEFGGVGCAPCRMSIPHLSALSKKYHNEVSVISVFVFENGFTPEDTISKIYSKRVSDFIANMGNKISYSVGIDDPRQFMGTHWVKAAGLNGIPDAFVIDRQGKIAWIGNPMDLDPVLAELTGGIFNKEKILTAQYAHDSLMNAVSEFVNGKNYGKALEVINEFIREDPLKIYLYPTKFEILLGMNESNAYIFGRELLRKECRNSEPALFYMARMIKDNAGSLLHPNWTLAIDCTRQALLLSRDDIVTSYILALQADLYEQQHDYPSAYSAELAAIGLLKSNSVKDETTISGYEKQLDYYRKHALDNSPR